MNTVMPFVQIIPLPHNVTFVPLNICSAHAQARVYFLFLRSSVHSIRYITATYWIQ